MTKADQIRLQAWRFRPLQQAAATGNVAQTTQPVDRGIVDDRSRSEIE